MNRQEKTAQIEEIKELLDGTQFVVLTEYAGLDVESMVALRAELRKADSGYRVMKNTLAKLATADTDMAELAPYFRGPIGVCFTKGDPAVTAKVLVNFKKEHEKLELKAGYLAGGKVLDGAAIEALSKLPSMDQLRGMFLSTLVGVPRNFVSLMAAVPRNFVGVLEARRRDVAGE